MNNWAQNGSVVIKQGSVTKLLDFVHLTVVLSVWFVISLYEQLSHRNAGTVLFESCQTHGLTQLSTMIKDIFLLIATYVIQMYYSI